MENAHVPDERVSLSDCLPLRLRVKTKGEDVCLPSRLEADTGGEDFVAKISSHSVLSRTGCSLPSRLESNTGGEHFVAKISSQSVSSRTGCSLPPRLEANTGGEDVVAKISSHSVLSRADCSSTSSHLPSVTENDPVPNERAPFPDCLPPRLEVCTGGEDVRAAEYSHNMCKVSSLQSHSSQNSVFTISANAITDTTTPTDLCRPSMEGMASNRVSRASRRTSTKLIESDPSFILHEPDFIRAVPLGAALRMVGKHWRDNSGSDFTFNLSSPTTSIDFFFSHSWRSLWWLKVIAILYYFNGTSACAAALVVHLMFLSLRFAGYGVPWLDEGIAPAFMSEPDQVVKVEFNFRYVPACLAFFVVFLFKQRMAMRPPSCFLDKMCINQTDPDKKLKGVQQLGALLRFSKHMMVLWQPEYLTRLWCVFELAAFTHLHGHKPGALVFYPLKLPLLAMCLCIFHFVASLSLTVLSPLTLHSEWHITWMRDNVHPSLHYLYLWAVYCVICFAGLYCIPSFFLWRFCKWQVADAQTIYSQLLDFKVSRTQCFLEEDREYVTRCVERWFGTTGDFEDYVQHELRDIVLQHKGEKLRLPFSLFVVGSLSHLFIGTNFMADCWLAGASMSAASSAMVTVFISFCSDSLALHLTLRLAASGFEDRQPSSFAFSKLAGPLLTACLFSAANATGIAMLTACLPLWTSACILLLGISANLLVSCPEVFYKFFTGRLLLRQPASDPSITS